MISLKSPSNAIKKILAVAVLIFIMLYALFEARGLILGPILGVNDSFNGESVTDSVVHIEGSTRSVSEIKINGRTIALHENGHFSNAVVLKEGYNEIVLEAKDRFGREINKTLQIMHERKPFPLEKLTHKYEEQKDNQDS